MPRHKFAIDLLRPGITIEEIIQTLDSKQELTPEDIKKIGDNAEKVLAASVTIQRRT